MSGDSYLGEQISQNSKELRLLYGIEACLNVYLDEVQVRPVCA